MTTRLGPYWSVMHRRPQDYAFFRDLQPTVIKLMDGGEPDYAWVRASLPGALVLARDWAMSEQHDDMRRDPAGTGKRHAQEWAQHAGRLSFDRAKTLVLGINEPRVWEAGIPAALTAYTVAFLDECARLGLRGGALQFGVGWPANVGPDMPPNWNPYAPVQDAIRRGNHALVCHEYWADGGPGELWGWWAGRSLKCPWDVPIIIGECGVDLYVKNPGVPHNQRGWRSHMDADRYARELAEYVTRMSADKRFVGCCVFAADYANGEWESFDIEPAYRAILAHAPQVATGTTVYAPVIGTPPAPKPPSGPTVPTPVKPANLAHPIEDAALRVVSQRFGDNPDAYQPFGVRGHTGIDYAVPVGTPVRAVDGGTVVEALDDPAGWGKYVKLSHAWGQSLYAHLSRQDAGYGATVARGQQIGLSGNTGNVTGPHLHVGLRLNPIRRGADDPTGMDGYSDPAPYLPQAAVDGKAKPKTPDYKQVWAIVQEAATEFGVDKYLLAALLFAESSWRADAVSPAGAIGLGQLMLPTWDEWSVQVGARDPFDASDNARTAAAYLRWLLSVAGSERAALHAYSWGIGRVLAGNTPPDEVETYATKILFARDVLKAIGG